MSDGSILLLAMLDSCTKENGAMTTPTRLQRGRLTKP
jgi:hypothetical protein